MSYVRPAKVEEVVAWLVANAYVEREKAEELAKALVNKWDLVGVFSKPS